MPSKREERVPTPASAFKKLEPGSDRYHRDITRARAEGVAEGRTKARSEVIDFLHKKYMDPKVKRDTEPSEAILELTRELVTFLGGRSDS